MTLRRIITLLALVLSLSACKRKESPPPGVVASIGERQITLQDFRKYLLRNAGTELPQVPPEAASALLDQFVEEVLISEHASKQGVDVSSERVAAAVRNDPGSTAVAKRDEMRRAALIDQLSAEVTSPTDEDIQKYYQDHLQEFDLAERVRARQILLHEEKQAEDLRRRIQAGESFQTLSAQHSLAPNAKQGGEIGYVSRGQLPKLFEDEIFALEPGKVSKVIRTDGSWHLFMVDDHAPAGRLEIESAAPTIRNRLQESALERELARAVAEAREEIPVSVLPRRLPFAYSGSYPQNTNE